MSSLHSRWTRFHILLIFTIFGVSGDKEKAIDLEQLKNEVQILHKLTDKLEEDIQSYERTHNDSGHENLKNTTSNLTANVVDLPPNAKQTTNRGLNKEHWPTFNELLQLSNKKYDWKNDRWIRVPATPQSNQIHHIDLKNKFTFKTLRYDHNSNKHYVVAVSSIQT